MAPKKQIGIVKTAQMADTLKLVMEGRVVGSVVVINDETAELRDHRDHVIGTFADAAEAIAEFEKMNGFEEIELDL